VKTFITRLALPVCALVFVASTATAQVKQESTPTGVTEKTIAEGEALFKGAGICFTCHGQDAKGVPGLGANLTDDEWTQADGTYESIIETITKGATSSTGAVMPPRGGPSLTDEQVNAVAAYVWSLSHKPAK
jgi:cbb3-type cytochrome c oxidase subunit III